MSTTIDHIIDAVRERLFRLEGTSRRVEFPLGLVVVSSTSMMVGRFDLRQGKVQFTLRKGLGDILTAPVDLALIDKRGRVHRFKFDDEALRLH